MKLKIFIIFIFISINYNVFANTYIEKEIYWHKVKVIKYDISWNEYKLKFVKSDSWESLKDLTIENNWITWVNWVFFCPADYSDCKWKENTTNNERYFDWVKYNFWETTWDRVVFWLDKDNKPLLFQTNKINPKSEWEIKNWFSNWPLLLKDWKNQLEYYWDINMVDKKMRASMSRNFICNDKEKKYIYFWYVFDAYMDDMPVVLNELWCYDALNLDAWWSTAFVYNWKYLLWPWRNIIDWVVIERKWLDVKKVIEKAKAISEEVKKKLDKYIAEKKIKSLDKAIKDLNKEKNTIYEKYSKDIVENIDWETKTNWYEIEINDVKVLWKIYLINNLIWELKSYLYILKKEEEKKS